MMSVRSWPGRPGASGQPLGIAPFTLALAADAGGQCGLVLSVVAGIAPVLVDQMGADARSRPARRRPELTARAAAPLRAAASSSSGRGVFCAVAHVGAARVQRQARRSAHGGAWRRADPSPPGAPGCRGRQAADGMPVHSGIGPPEPDQAAAGLPADGPTLCLAAGIGDITLLIT
jgi:hypothetical protein